MYLSATLVVIALSSPSFESGMQWFKMRRVDPIKMAMVLLLIVLIFLGTPYSTEGDAVCAVIFYDVVLMTSVGMSFGSNDLPEWMVMATPTNPQTDANGGIKRDRQNSNGAMDTTTTRCYNYSVGAILLSGAVILRKALWMCPDMLAYTTLYHGDEVVSTCTTCDAKSAFLLAFTSSAALVAAALTIVRPNLTQSALTLAFSGMLQCICVLCLFIAQDQTAASMPALFENGCFVHDQCPVAYQARRLVSSTHATGSTTFLAFATVALAAQLVDRSMKPHQESQRTMFIIILLTATAMLAILIVFSVSNFESFEASIDVALLLTLAGVVIGSIVDELLGATCINVAITIDFVFYYIRNVGLDVAFTYFTIMCNVACILFFVMLVITLVVDRLVVRLPVVTQMLILCGRSVAWFLALCSTSLFAIYDGGALPQRGETDPVVARTAFAFLLWHYAPIIVWVMIARSLPSVHTSRPVRVYTWIAAVIGVCLVYTFALSMNTGKPPSEYPLTRVASMAVVLILVISPCWISAL